MNATKPRTAAKQKHNRKGNCWDVSVIYDCRRCHLPEEICDVCHKHDEPRGQCDECPRCAACDKDERLTELGRRVPTRSA